MKGDEEAGEVGGESSGRWAAKTSSKWSGGAVLLTARVVREVSESAQPRSDRSDDRVGRRMCRRSRAVLDSDEERGGGGWRSREWEGQMK